MTGSRILSALAAGLVIATALLGGAAVVAADEPAIQISPPTTAAETAVVGETVTVETDVTNLKQTNGTVDITAVYLRITDSTEEYARLGNGGTLAPGGTLTVPVQATFEEPGEKDLTLHVTVRDETGEYYSYSSPFTLDVEPAEVRGELSTTTANESGRTAVTLTNIGNVPFTDVEIRALEDGAVTDRRLARDIDPDGSRTVTFDRDRFDAESVTFVAAYTADNESHQQTRTVELDREVPGEIRLTSVEARPGGGTVTLDGEAANVGGTDVQSVLVSVRDTDGVTPVAGAGEFFVGSVDASEFATFELAASVDNGTSAVPVEVAYIVDGDRVTETQTVQIPSADGTPAASSGQVEGGAAESQDAQRGGFPVLPVVVFAVLALGGGGLYYVWNRE